jgi:glycosyltransferase involved in cell wall biosynthesis
VGWVEIGKGILDLIEAAALLVSKGETSFLITIAGDGHARTEVEKLISIYHLENYFNLLGWVDPNELVPLYAMNEIFILPSYAEGLPNSMIEAMAAGLGIVVTPVGNITDVIHDEINGIIIEAKNTEMIANKIYDLINDRKKLIKIASNAHNTACKNFAVEPVIDLIEKEILSLVKNVTKS